MPRGNGKLYVTFVDVGHGDCTIIACPNGKIVLIDCGSARWGNSSIDDIKNVIFDNKRYLYTNNGYGSESLTVEALIISHPDRDHYNQIVPIFWELDAALRATRFETIYHVMDLAHHNESGFSHWAHSSANRGNITPVYVNSLVGNTPLEIVDGTAIGGPQCKIYILAANYVKPGHENLIDDYKRNEASIVVKIVFGNDSIIITGDATIDTEEFMMRKYENTDWLESNFLRLGHHGSKTSSSDSFIDAVSAKAVVVSCKIPSSYRVPNKDIVQECKTWTDETIHHQIAYYNNIPHTDPEIEATNEHIYLTGLDGSLPYTFDGT